MSITTRYSGNDVIHGLWELRYKFPMTFVEENGVLKKLTLKLAGKWSRNSLAPKPTKPNPSPTSRDDGSGAQTATEAQRLSREEETAIMRRMRDQGMTYRQIEQAVFGTVNKDGAGKRVSMRLRRAKTPK